MSQTFYLVCHETKQRIWIGQGWGSMTSFYCGDKVVMDNLKGFLNANRGKPLYLTTLDEERICDYVAIGDCDDLSSRPPDHAMEQIIAHHELEYEERQTRIDRATNRRLPLPPNPAQPDTVPPRCISASPADHTADNTEHAARCHRHSNAFLVPANPGIHIWGKPTGRRP